MYVVVVAFVVCCFVVDVSCVLARQLWYGN